MKTYVPVAETLKTYTGIYTYENGAYAFMSAHCPNLYLHVTFPLSFWTSHQKKHSIKALLETFLFPLTTLKTHFLQNKGVFVKLNSL